MTPVPDDLRGWAEAADGQTLQQIRTHAAEIRARLEEDTPWPSVALARLFNADGTDAEVLAVVERWCARMPEPSLLAAAAAGHRAAGRLDDAVALYAKLAAEAREASWRASGCAHLARLYQLQGRDQRAGDALREAKAHLDADPSARVGALVYAVEATLRCSEERFRDALDSLHHAIGLGLTYSAAELCLLFGLRGNIEFDLGFLQSAEASFEQAIDRARAASIRSVAAIYAGYLGWCLAEQGKSASPQRLRSSAVECTALGLERFSHQFAALRAALFWQATDPLRLEAALGSLRATGDVQRANALEVLHVASDLRAASQANGRRERLFHLCSAHERIEAAPRVEDDGRIAVRSTRRLLHEFVSRSEAPAPNTLAVELGALSGYTSQGPFDLREHSKLSRLLWTLVCAWSEGKGASDEQLIERAWGDDQSSIASKRRRLRVAVSELRKRVVGDGLQRVHGGYRLEQECEIIAN
ncbi:MAG: helix-turn-helix domain-containing protein [Myxococcota bacterium]